MKCILMLGIFAAVFAYSANRAKRQDSSEENEFVPFSTSPSSEPNSSEESAEDNEQDNSMEKVEPQEEGSGALEASGNIGEENNRFVRQLEGSGEEDQLLSRFVRQIEGSGEHDFDGSGEEVQSDIFRVIRQADPEGSGEAAEEEGSGADESFFSE